MTLAVGERLPHVHLYIPPGAAAFVSVYTPRKIFETEIYAISVPFDHPDCLLHMLPYPARATSGGYVQFKSKFAPEVDVRPASYRWLVDQIEENKARNLRDTTIFEAHALELELTPYHWTFQPHGRSEHPRSGTSYYLDKVTILRQPGD